jgi:hypothetical protein
MPKEKPSSNEPSQGAGGVLFVMIGLPILVMAPLFLLKWLLGV